MILWEKKPKDREAKTLTKFFVELARADLDVASNVIAAYIKEDKKQVEQGKISSQTVPNHIKPIKVGSEPNGSNNKMGFELIV